MKFCFPHEAKAQLVVQLEHVVQLAHHEQDDGPQQPEETVGRKNEKFSVIIRCDVISISIDKKIIYSLRHLNDKKVQISIM